ncbi:MAG: precorrin-2 C(20)-methyltransferase [Pirellulales bacterium]|nr:precorrin-2 C(20)-methyltransferase [Pirellulales bacterium]
MNGNNGSNYARLYGVGVGPGAPDLMTLRSVELLSRVDVIAIPRSNKYTKSVAWRIAEPNLPKVDGQERLILDFPMTKDPKVLAPAWDIAFSKIGRRIEAGQEVAFICEGDPLFYSTFNYLKNQAQTRWPGIEIEIIPAVSSFTAVPSVIQTTIADGQERVAVVPASYGLDEIPAILELFDTVLLMKVSSVMPQLVDVLRNCGVLENSVYVSKATMEHEKVVTDLTSIQNDKCDYFSMVVIKQHERSGVLEGAVRG